MLIVLTAVPCGSSILQGAAGIYNKETPSSDFFNPYPANVEKMVSS
jgi:hypothetical protein